MKRFVLFLIMSAFFGAQPSRAEEDIQTYMAKVLLKAGVVLIRNDSALPVLVTKEMIGSDYACVSSHRNNFRVKMMRLVEKNFRNSPVLSIACGKDGMFVIRDDFI